MSYRFGKRSQENLDECHQDIHRVFQAIIKERDCSIVEGHRTEAEQNYAKKMGHSKLSFPQSRHNCMPSLAVDAWPYPRPDWNDTAAWEEWAKYVVSKAADMGVPLLSGGLAWGWDYPHFQLPANWPNVPK